ncbi:hypothetical protein ACHAWF_000387, partial [Thalassiosira exigua]
MTDICPRHTAATAGAAQTGRIGVPSRCVGSDARHGCLDHWIRVVAARRFIHRRVGIAVADERGRRGGGRGEPRGQDSPGSAAAQTGKASTALNAFESELGSQPPLGFFDLHGMLDNADQERFDRLRYFEIKHGRICQLAFLSQITTRTGVHLGGA